MINKAIFAGGCFWGVEAMFQGLNGVTQTRAGYIGGTAENPSYEEVCEGETGHKEAIEIEYDPEKISYENLTKMFFEIHDFTQTNGQGPDIGEQYKSVIFYEDENQEKIAKNIVEELTKKGYKVATKLEKASKFWPAENYHQKYYEKTGKSPYCHYRREIF